MEPGGAAVSAALIATVKAYRRTGGAIVTVEREGRTRRWRTSGAWLRSSMACSIWEVRP